MEFRIADTFQASMNRLAAQEQKAVKTTAFDLQLNPASPGLSFHKLDRARDPRFWSVRVNDDIRIIVHRSESSLLLCYVDHHDKAYAWAERRKLDVHPKTGAAQLVEVRETVQEIFIPQYVVQEKPAAAKKLLFASVAEEQLLGYGVPPEWLADVQHADEDSLFGIAEHLPAEAAEALLTLATGGKPAMPQPVPAGTDPFAHPDAQRRFRVMHNTEELARALDYPWEKWSVFLHPSQRQMVERDYTGPARVSGSAGTGKTIVALHRAVHLARTHPDARVLLVTFSDVLAANLYTKVRRLLYNEPRLGERLDVYSMNALGRRLYELYFGKPRIASSAQIAQFLKEAADKVPANKFSVKFLMTEWEEVVDACQIDTWESYRDVKRLGRKTRLPEPQRLVLWSIFEQVRSRLEEQKLITYDRLFCQLASRLTSGQRPPFDFAVVDEAQDVSIPQLQFLAALGGKRPNSLFFAGDLGQRIFQQPFSWSTYGVDIRGRSRTLTINYRTSHQIRRQADQLLGTKIADVDGNTEDRSGTISVFNGPKPVVRVFDTQEEESEAVGEWLQERLSEGVKPQEMGVFVRSAAQLDRGQQAIKSAGLTCLVLDDQPLSETSAVVLSTMHSAKGLEFRAVVVLGCDDEIIPLQERIETVTDETELEEVYNTERHLLYVACTRARDFLLVTGTDPASEFLEDLQLPRPR